MNYYYRNNPVELIVELPDGECVIQFKTEIFASDDYYAESNPPKLVVSSKEITSAPIDFDYETQKAIKKLEKVKSSIRNAEAEYSAKIYTYEKTITTLIDTNNRMQKSFETLCTLTKQQQEKYDSLIINIGNITGK